MEVREYECIPHHTPLPYNKTVLKVIPLSTIQTLWFTMGHYVSKGPIVAHSGLQCSKGAHSGP